MQTMSASRADTYINVWRNTSDQQSPITEGTSMERILRPSAYTGLFDLWNAFYSRT